MSKTDVFDRIANAVIEKFAEFKQPMVDAMVSITRRDWRTSEHAVAAGIPAEADRCAFCLAWARSSIASAAVKLSAAARYSRWLPLGCPARAPARR